MTKIYSTHVAIKISMPLHLDILIMIIISYYYRKSTLQFKRQTVFTVVYLHSECYTVHCVVVADNETAGNETAKLRLVNTHNSSKPEGRLEIYHNSIWGTICDDSFDPLDADVACRQLGFVK